MFILLLVNTALATPPDRMVQSGFRMGYGYVENESLKSKHLMVLGWDHMQFIETGSNVDVVLAGNLSLGGMNQGTVLPSAHMIVGYQTFDALQFGVGPVLTFSETEPELEPKLNMIVAAGWNIQMGDVYFPLHAAYVPDLDNQWRVYITTGMNWTIRQNN